MPTYSYSAMNDSGRTIRGSILAENDVDLEVRLKEIGLDLVKFREQKQKKAGMTSRVKQKDMIILCLQLEQLNRAGVPIHEALSDVRDSTDSLKLKDIMTDVCESVKGGAQLSESFAKYPNTFGDVFVGLIKAGEKNGNLTESFMQIVNHMKWTTDLKRKVKKAIRYPIALGIVMSLVITVLMMFVVPKLITFIIAQGFAIPIHTRALIAVSGAFKNYWYLIFSIPIVSGVTLFTLYKTSEPFAYRVDSLLLSLPVIGPTIRKINMARFTHFFSVMFKSGIDILDSLGSARSVVGNRVLKEAIDTLIRSVNEGNSLTASLRISSQFPNLVVRMFKVGEDSGNMNEALENIKFFYDREVNDAVDGMVGLIQPTMTAVMGGLIFWVIAAVFGPLYQSFSNMKF